MHESDTRTRTARHRERRAQQYRKRRLMALAVLVGLSMGVGAYAGGFLQDSGGSEAGYPAAKVGEVPSSGVAPDEAQESTAPSVEKARLPAYETKDDLIAPRGSELTHDPALKPAPGEPPKVPAESLNVLVLGVDRRPEATEGSSSHSDTIMLVQATPETGRVQSLSVPRDLLVEVAPGVEDRINTAYLYGGVEQATTVMENLTGIPIDRYAIVDFGGFEEVVNALGGITLEVEQPIRVGIEGRRVYIPPGRQELNGLEALAYARYRGTSCGDLDRIERQQQLVATLREQALGWNTVTKLPSVVKVMHENVDTNLGIVPAISLGRALVGHGRDAGMRSAQLKGKPEVLPDGDAVLVPDEQANERLLEKFRNGGLEVRRSDRAPRPEGSSSEC